MTAFDKALDMQRPATKVYGDTDPCELAWRIEQELIEQEERDEGMAES